MIYALSHLIILASYTQKQRTHQAGNLVAIQTQPSEPADALLKVDRTFRESVHYLPVIVLRPATSGHFLQNLKHKRCGRALFHPNCRHFRIAVTSERRTGYYVM